MERNTSKTSTDLRLGPDAKKSTLPGDWTINLPKINRTGIRQKGGRVREERDTKST
eukprot:SAG31_NODE_108_length_24741_cov_6.933041_9_plen_56_part_00